ncbi:MAG: DUF4315 family protein [Firmicutes bacterium]|nr:DUF4315 family protein [Mogibacterium sp.]MBR0456946.1 DUF4315 family protein [Bacillota bacterium]
MNKRIRKCLREEDQIDKKIAELMSQKADLEVARGQEEEKEIIRIIRGMKLEKHDLADLLDGLKSGEISLLKSEDFLDEDDGSSNAPNEKNVGAYEHAPESEADYGSQANE